MTSLTIGQLCERTGEPAHVLRHWEDAGVLHPRRTPAGHRRYHPGTVAAVRTVRRLQRVGLSLADIVALRRSSRVDRRERIDAHRARLVADRASIDAALTFLEHTLACHHPVIDDCPDCSGYARGRSSDQAEASAQPAQR